MKITFFFLLIAFTLACELVFCKEYKTEFDDGDKTVLRDIVKTEFEDGDKTELEDDDKNEYEDDDKTEFDNESVVDDPRRRCKSSKHHLIFYSF